MHIICVLRDYVFHRVDTSPSPGPRTSRELELSIWPTRLPRLGKRRGKSPPHSGRLKQSLVSILNRQIIKDVLKSSKKKISPW